MVRAEMIMRGRFLHCSQPLLILVLTYYCLLLVQAETAEQCDEHHHHLVTLVKIGGSVLTDKAVKETLNTTTLDWFTQTLADAVIKTNQRFVVIHGAGSFGHFQAKEYGLKSVNSKDTAGATVNNHRRKGLAKTRLSVQTLNRLVIESFVEKGDLPAVGISPSFSGMTPSNCYDSVDGDRSGWKVLLEDVLQPSVAAGFLPVLHGDTCLYNGGQNVGILSGDVLMSAVGEMVDRVVFLTDVAGVFTSDPKTNSDAKLVPHVQVNSEGNVVTALEATGSSHEHDVTGGLETKLGAAATIAAKGKTVWMVQSGTDSAKTILMGLEDENREEGVVATRITRRE